MTKKRKIEILKYVIENLEKSNRYYGICYWIRCQLTAREYSEYWYNVSISERLKQFKIIPTPYYTFSFFYYPQTASGNQQRINACKRAIKILEK